MRVISVVGARPQFVKLAAISAAFAGTAHEHVIIHTGQHYDSRLSDVFFSGLGIPAAQLNLGIGSGTHGVQTGSMLMALDPVLLDAEPDWVLVYGDTNSTLAATLSAVKLQLRVAHLEAGLRSFNREMPEEHNRVLTDHAADLLLAPSQTAVDQLTREGLAERSVLVGDVMVDICLRVRDRVLADGHTPRLPVRPGEPYLLATIHRPSNTDAPGRLEELLAALARVGTPVVLLAHPRLVAKAAEAGIELDRDGVRVVPPLPYTDLVAAVLGSIGVVTDSGGLQKEAFLLARPCTTLRAETEWVETLDDGWNVLVDNPGDLTTREWRATVTRTVSRPGPAGAPDSPAGSPYGMGDAAARSLRALEDRLRSEDH